MAEAHIGRFPAGLLDWAGNRSGGVKRLFYSASGRPSGDVVLTPLLSRLQNWAETVVVDPKTPRVVLLVGGPGNGKTEAIEYAIHRLDAAYGLSGGLVRFLQSKFLADDGNPVPRLVVTDLSRISGNRINGEIDIVQDASVAEASRKESPAQLFVEDLASLVANPNDRIYLACVNRGVLDDALIVATDSGQASVQSLLSIAIQSVGLNPEAPACWPLSQHPHFAVWPMDVETLIESPDGQAAPIVQLLDKATSREQWAPYGTCAAGEYCPFCTSASRLSEEPFRSSLLRILRWYELASGKRWSFRDLFTLISFLLARVPPDYASTSYMPCDWAARMLALSNNPSAKPISLRTSAIYHLVGAQYQHSLFGAWPTEGIRRLRLDLQELQFEENSTLMGLYYYLNMGRQSSIPPTLQSQLSRMAMLLDPAIADPDMEVPISSRSTIHLRDLDTRFSHSVGEGRTFIQKYQCLTSLEVELLRRLDEADSRLSDEDVSRRKPAIALRVRSIVRDFACRMVRRSIGVRAGVVRDAIVLSEFEKVNKGDPQILHDAVKQVDALLNDKDGFRVVLNTTFGEPAPAEKHQAVLKTIKQRVKPLDVAVSDRPSAPVRFLNVGSGKNWQAIPLTYELFRSVRDLRNGMISASLPRPVVALLDTTRATLSGRIVRDEELLDGSEIHIGSRSDVIVRELGKFLVKRK